MKAIYRAATSADCAAWVALRFELWPECPKERHALEVEQLLSSKGIVALAEAAASIVGFAEVSIRADHVEGTTDTPVPYLEGWYVQAEYRHLGIGRGLLSFVENWALSEGYRELASDAEIENQRSITLHSEFGFREAGRSVHFVKRLGPKNA